MVQIIAIKYFLLFQVLNYKQIYTNQQMLYLKLIIFNNRILTEIDLPVDGVNVVADAAAGK